MKSSHIIWSIFLTLGLSAPVMAQSSLFVQRENQFAIDFYRQQAREPGNFVVSPYSAATALGMVYVGAKGQTAAEIAAALHVQDMSLADFERQAARPALDKTGLTFTDSNALWAQRGFPLKPDYMQTIWRTFGGCISEVDFSDADDASARINAWVQISTDNKIQSVVTPQMFQPPPKLVLVNAVYFKAV